MTLELQLVALREELITEELNLQSRIKQRRHIRRS